MNRQSSPCGWYWNGDKRNGQRDSHRLWIRIRGAGHDEDRLEHALTDEGLGERLHRGLGDGSPLVVGRRREPIDRHHADRTGKPWEPSWAPSWTNSFRNGDTEQHTGYTSV
jgi:hypothetical protein